MTAQPPVVATQVNTKTPITLATWKVIALLLLPLILIYSNTFSTPWVFDDSAAIEKNPTIRTWAWVNGPLQPIGDGSPVTARPLLNLTFAINYAISELQPWSYRAANLLLHGLTALTLYGLLRRILSQTVFTAGCRYFSVPLALVTSLLWAVHPLHTNVVTYTSQRAEGLAALLYLLALYALVRGMASPGKALYWWVICIAVCYLGTMAKETIATLPIIALVMDRMFFATSWREVFRQRALVHVGLLSSWVFLGLFVLFGGNRAGSAGFLSIQAAIDYALLQPQAMMIYLSRVFVPVGLVFDYGIFKAQTWHDWLPGMAVMGVLIVLTLAGWWRGYKAAFAGVWFFVLLMPTSSVLPIVTQTMAEHRAYLSSAGIIALLVVGGFSLWQRYRNDEPARIVQPRSLLVIVTCAVIALSLTTLRRNQVFGDAVELWRDTTSKRPESARAWNNMAVAMLHDKNQSLDATLEVLDRALMLDPDHLEARSNRGNLMVRMGRFAEAIQEFTEAGKRKSNFLEVENGLTVAYCELRRWEKAIHHGLRTVELAPHWDGAWYNLGNAFLGATQFKEAAQAYQRSLGINPNQPSAWNNLALTLMRDSQLMEAEKTFFDTVNRFPLHAEAWANYGQLLGELNRPHEAVAAYQRALQARADYFKVYLLMAEQLVVLGQTDHARTVLEGVIELAQQNNVTWVQEEAKKMLQMITSVSSP